MRSGGAGVAVAIIGTALFGLTGGAAFAQDDPPPVIIIDDTRKPDERQDPAETRNRFSPRFSLVLGGFLPFGRLAEEFPNRWGGSALFQVQLNPPRPSRPFALSLYYEGVAVSQGVPDSYDFGIYSRSTAEYMGMQGGGAEVQFYLSQGAPLRVYVGGGGGIYELKREVSFSGNGFLEPVFTRDDLFESARVTVGYSALAGIEVGRHFVAEARYVDAGVLNGVAFRGLSVSIGFRY